MRKIYFQSKGTPPANEITSGKITFRNFAFPSPKISSLVSQSHKINSFLALFLSQWLSSSDHPSKPPLSKVPIFLGLSSSPIAMALDASKKPKKKPSGGAKPSKRKTNPGVRVVGGRIYDSSNGKCCHQVNKKTSLSLWLCHNRFKLCFFFLAVSAEDDGLRCVVQGSEK